MSASESSQAATSAVDWGPAGAARAPGAPLSPQRFARYHRGDRNFFLIYVALIWLGIFSGFGPQVAKHLRTNAAAYPPIVHIHAAVFVGWLTLLTAQVLLIRSGKLGLHRRLGIAGAALAALMIVIGPATAVIVDRLQLALPHPDPGFLVVQMLDILAFAGLIIPAFIWRKDPTVHKRLILLATLYISDAGFSRWQGDTMEAWFGNGFWGNGAQLYFGSDLLVIGVGLYDWLTRKRLHPAYIAGAAWTAAVQLTVISVYLSPGWAPVAARLLGQ
jgi:uncharacterized membrane protein YozB (DUF420 family)